MPVFLFLCFYCIPLYAEWAKKPEEYVGQKVRVEFHGIAPPFEPESVVEKEGFVAYELLGPKAGGFVFNAYLKAPVDICYVAESKVEDFETLYLPSEGPLCMIYRSEIKPWPHPEKGNIYCFKLRHTLDAVLWRVDDKFVLVYK